MFVDSEALNKCVHTKISFFTAKGKEYFSTQQSVAHCYGREAIRNVKTRYQFFRNTIGIYVEGSSMMIFKYITGFSVAILLDLLDVYKQPTPEKISDDIFHHPIPHNGQIIMTVIHFLYYKANR